MDVPELRTRQIAKRHDLRLSTRSWSTSHEGSGLPVQPRERRQRRLWLHEPERSHLPGDEQARHRHANVLLLVTGRPFVDLPPRGWCSACNSWYEAGRHQCLERPVMRLRGFPLALSLGVAAWLLLALAAWRLGWLS